MSRMIDDETLANVRRGIATAPAKFAATAAMTTAILARLDVAEARAAHYEAAALEMWSKRVDQHQSNLCLQCGCECEVIRMCSQGCHGA